MRSFVLVASLLALGSVTSAFAECNGKAAVKTAFEKQIAHKTWRANIRSKDASGETQKEVYEFIAPDRMYRKVETRMGMIETIGIGRWAWTNIGGGYSELQPQFAQMVTSRLQKAFVEPKISADFNCLGDIAFEGGNYVAYQTAAEKTKDLGTLARTILIDPKTGLPAFNIVAVPDLKAQPIMQEAYTYPTNIKIERP